MSLSIGINLSIGSGFPVLNNFQLITSPSVPTENIKKAAPEVSSLSETTKKNNRIYQTLVNEQSININDRN
ncbi:MULTISPECIES: hypothetical protein [Photorhabdus]|uniref:hypothetical protein n=1 Tax=Photorhabdus TaxID=29487 RepID=UPI000A77DF5D|nr:hypothetical protein [Photorhabdus thracensis]